MMTKAQELIQQETKNAKQREKQNQAEKLKQDFENLFDKYGIKYTTKEVKLEGSNNRLDYVIVNEQKRKIAIALQGGVWSGGRHINPAGYIADRTKYNLAILEGWQVFELTNEHVKAMLSYQKIGSRIYETTKAVLEYCKKKQGGEK